MLLTIGVVATLLTATNWRNSVETKNASSFEDSARDIAANLDSQLQRNADLVASVTTFFRIEPDSSRHSFARWFGFLAAGDRYPGAERLGYVERVPRSQLDGFLARANRDIPEADGRVSTSPPGVRPIYCLSRAFVNGPQSLDLAPNQLQDFCQPNAFSETVQGVRLATDRGTLVSLPGFGELIYMYEPLYRGGVVPKTVAERRRAVTGWSIGMFHADEMVRSAVGDRKLEVQLMQRGRDGGYQVLASAGHGMGADSSSTTVPLTGDRQSAVRVSGIPGGAAVSPGVQAFVIVLVGWVFFGVLFLLIRTLSLGRENALSLVDERTRALRHSEARFTSIAASSPVGVLQTDVHGNFEYANKRFFEIFGLSRRDAHGRGWMSVFADGDCDRVMAMMGRSDSTQSDATEFRLPGREDRWISLSLGPLRDEDEITGIVASVEDVTVAHDARQKLAFEAHHDSLTGLPNRHRIIELLQDQLDRLESGGPEFALAYMDLDRFKPINDAFGHSAGDELLEKVGRRVAGNLRASDTLARHGGDEFLILLTSYSDRDAVETAIKRVRESVIKPFVVARGEQVTIDASFGLVYVDQPGMSAEQILQDADLAMYQAKRNRRHIETFRPSLRFENISQLETDRDLRDALLNDEFELWYQPVIDMKTNELAGAESLVRWRHPTRGILTPDQFLPLAETTGLIVPIGEHLVEIAAKFQSKCPKGFKVSVNISAQQLAAPGFVEKLLEKTERNGADRGLLLLEMIETDELTDDEIAIIDRTRKCGYRVGIDDFGTGYNSLLQLKRADVDFVKIDRTFVCDVEAGAATEQVLASIVQLSRALGLKVVAEGVETAEQAKLIAGVGSDFGQGYYWSEPLTESEFLGYAETYKAPRVREVPKPTLRAV